MEQYLLLTPDRQIRGYVDPIEMRDIDSLLAIVRTWVRKGEEVFEDEVEDIHERMIDAIQGSDDYSYWVLRDKECRVIGMAGLRKPEGEIINCVSSPDKKAVELVNVFLSSESRGKKLGRALIEAVFDIAAQQEYDEVILDSGPRYKETAWGFYNHVVGEPVSVIEGRYGTNPDGTTRDAPVWRKVLTDQV